MKQQSVPVNSWLIVAVLFISVQGGMYYHSDRIFPVADPQTEAQILQEKKNALQTDITIAHYLDQQRLHPSAYHVAMIGSSYTMESMGCTDALLEYSKEQFDTAIAVSRFFGLERPLEVMVKQAGLFDTLLKYPPDLILIQHDLLTFNFSHWKHRNRANRENLLKNKHHLEVPIDDRFISKLIAAYFRVGGVFRQNRENLVASINLKESQSVSPITPNPCGKQVDKEQRFDTLEVELKNRDILHFEDHAYSHPGIKAFQEAGIEVILVSVPRPQKMEAGFREKASHQKIEALLKTYQDKLQIAYWPCPLELPFAYYHDHGHMNAKGRSHYGPWLLQRIHQHLNPN